MLGSTGPARIRVESYPAALDLTDRPAPRSPHEARFSLQYAVATSLLRGRPALDAFDDAAIRDPAVLDLLGVTSVETNVELAAAYPARWGARVHVDAADGSRHVGIREQATGDPELPLDDEALDAKVQGLLDWGGLGPERSERLLRACRRLVRNGAVPSLPRST